MAAKDIIKYQFKKGQIANPKGRPKEKTLKEYARQYLSRMTEDERIKYLNSIDPEIVWKMAEGNAPQKTEIDGKIELPIPILPIGGSML